MGSADRGGATQVVSDLSAIARTLAGYPALARALTDPSMPDDNKFALVDDALPRVSGEARLIVKHEASKQWESSRRFTTQIGLACVDRAWTWARDDDILRATIDQVFSFGQAIMRNHDLRAALTDRRVDVETRQDLAESVATDLNPPAVAVIRAVVGFDHDTIDDRIREVVGRGVELIHAKLAIVTVAKPLDDDQKLRLVAALSKRQGFDVIVEEVIDPAVVGGVRVECGAEVIDSTIASRLDAARRALG